MSPARSTTLTSAQIKAIRLRLHRLRDEIGLIRRDRIVAKYDPNQPRVPAGNTGGGRWTSGSGGGGGYGARYPGTAGPGPDEAAIDPATDDASWASFDEGLSEDGAAFTETSVHEDGTSIRSEYAASREAGFDERQTVTLPRGDSVTFETSGRTQTISTGDFEDGIVRRSIWTPSGPEPDATVQPAFSRRDAASTIIAGGAALFNWQSNENGVDDLQTVMGFNARNYRAGEATRVLPDLTYVGRLSEKEAELACLYLPEVRNLTDRAANAAGSPELYPSRATFGTAIHKRFENFVKELHQPHFKAERSFLKEVEDPTSQKDISYGHPGSVRVDAYEYRADGTLCVYDLKTGRAGLGDRRAEILANAAKLGFINIRRIVVIEVRPRS